MFCSNCGNKNENENKFCTSCGKELHKSPINSKNTIVTSNAAKETLIRNICEHLQKVMPLLQFDLQQNTDIALYSLLANFKWLLGWRKVEYKAKLLLKEGEKQAVFWETVKESGQGMEVPFFLKKTITKTDSSTISGNTTEYGGSSAKNKYNYSWNYAQTRTEITNLLKQYGWTVEVVLLPHKAEY